MFVFFLINLTNNNQSNSANADKREQTVAKAMSPEAIAFAKEFVANYFTWNIDEGKEKRLARMDKYFIGNLHEQSNEIAAPNWNSVVTFDDIQLKETNDLEGNKVRFIFEVDVLFTKTKVVKTTSKNKKGKKKTKETTEEKKVAQTKYLSVPIVYDEKVNRYAIYQLPSFTYYDENRTVEHKFNVMEGLQVLTNGEKAENIKAFLAIFFESYANDSKDKLNYIVEDESHQNGLGKTMDFVDIQNAAVFEGKTDEEKVVTTDVIWEEPETEIQFASNYVLVVKEEGGQYIVKLINSKEYLDELKEQVQKKENNKQEKDS